MSPEPGRARGCAESGRSLGARHAWNWALPVGWAGAIASGLGAAACARASGDRAQREQRAPPKSRDRRSSALIQLSRRSNPGLREPPCIGKCRQHCPSPPPSLSCVSKHHQPAGRPPIGTLGEVVPTPRALHPIRFRRRPGSASGARSEATASSARLLPPGVASQCSATTTSSTTSHTTHRREWSAAKLSDDAPAMARRRRSRENGIG